MQRPEYNRAREQEKFEQFLFEMDDVLNQFVDAAAAAGFELDYSFDSLDVLERYCLARKTSNSADDSFVSAAARYYGEVVRKVYGGKWYLEIDNPKHLLYGLPVLVGYAPSRVKLSPHQTIRMFAKGKPAGFLKRVIDTDRQPRVLDLKPEA
jgi:hypothetical protein